MRFVPRSDIDTETMVAESKLKHAKTYNIDAVKRALCHIYSGCCAYCEGEVESVAYFEIEHFYPKEKFPQWRKDFHNLHFACPRCNRLKGQSIKEILSPNYYNHNGAWEAHPDEIDSCLRYVGHMLFINPDADESLQKRGNNTIQLFQLNKRPSLTMERIRKYAEAYSLVEVIYDILRRTRDKDSKQMDRVLHRLFRQLINYTEPNSAYSTMIIQNFGDEICKLLEIWKCIQRKSQRGGCFRLMTRMQ